MSILHRLDADLKSAMKASDAPKVSVLRMLKAALKNKQIDVGRELSDEEIISVLSAAAKQRNESIEQFTKGGRQDLADKENNELSIIRGYLPEQLSLNNLDRIITDAISEASAAGRKDLGAIMRIVMPKVKGAADGKLVNQRVKDLLENA